MIRIIDAKNRKPVLLSNEQKSVFQLLGIVVIDQSAELIHLLQKYGVSISNDATNLQVINAIVNTIEFSPDGYQDESFNEELAEIFEKQVIPDNYDSFNANALFENEYDNFAVGSSFQKLFKSIKKSISGNKKAKTQAKGEAMKSSMEFQVQQDESSEKEKSASKKSKIIKIAAVTTIAAAVIGVIIWKVNKGKTSQLKLT